MQGTYWRKRIQRKLTNKEDASIVNSDAELDLKIELFKNVDESSTNLCQILQRYKEVVDQLSLEEQSLGRFLKEAGKNSQSSSSAMIKAGKVISYLGQQHHTMQAAFFMRIVQEINTFKSRAVVDTKKTILNMEEERTAYRAALTYMKNCGSDLDPDSGKGIEKYRKAQNFVKYAKVKFDKYTLACLQKIDLLAAARCNLFSYSLATYQTNWLNVCMKNHEALKINIILIASEPITHGFALFKEMPNEKEKLRDEKNLSEIEPTAIESEAKNKNDKDHGLFFGEDFSDQTVSSIKLPNFLNENNVTDELENSSKLIDYGKDYFDELMSTSNMLPSQLLLDDSTCNNVSLSTNLDLLKAFSQNAFKPMEPNQLKKPDQLSIENNSINQIPPNKNTNETAKWFQLFSELDPLNQLNESNEATKNLHAA